MYQLIIISENDTIQPSKTIIGGIELDRITEGFLDEFSSSQNIGTLDISKRFEHFANYCALSAEIGFVENDIFEMLTGEATPGIDGIAIEVNGCIVETTEEISVLINQNKRLDVKFIFVQAKTSDSFDNADISGFLTFISIFFSDKAKSSFSTDEMLKFIEMKELIYANSKYMKAKNPIIKMYYIVPGTWNSTDAKLNSVIDQHIDSLRKTFLFSDVRFVPCGSPEIQLMYRKSKEQIESSFVFSRKVNMFNDANGDYGYSGVLPFKEYVKIICDENGSLKKVFEDNIRDFLGQSNYVNADIEQTILEGWSSAFCMLNNGITIVSHSAVLVGDIMTISDYQIVNGCQTSHVLYLNRDKERTQELLIPIKIIVTSNEELKNRITKATNNQTSITKEQLEALSTFQKNLEEYYLTYTDENQRLYYERRTGQYRGETVSNSRIVTIRSQIKNASSMFNDKPHDAAGHYNSLLKDIGAHLFLANDQQILYYTSSLALFRLESLIRTRQIPQEFRKGRYHIIMLLKYLTGGNIPKYHNSKKMITFCERILKTLNDEPKCVEYFTKIVEYIGEQEDLDLTERKVFERKETTDILLRNKDKLISKF